MRSESKLSNGRWVCLVEMLEVDRSMVGGAGCSINSQLNIDATDSKTTDNVRSFTRFISLITTIIIGEGSRRPPGQAPVRFSHVARSGLASLLPSLWFYLLARF
jgi:hypothetical protein